MRSFASYPASPRPASLTSGAGGGGVLDSLCPDTFASPHDGLSPDSNGMTKGEGFDAALFLDALASPTDGLSPNPTGGFVGAGFAAASPTEEWRSSGMEESGKRNTNPPPPPFLHSSRQIRGEAPRPGGA